MVSSGRHLWDQTRPPASTDSYRRKVKPPLRAGRQPSEIRLKSKGRLKPTMSARAS